MEAALGGGRRGGAGVGECGWQRPWGALAESLSLFPAGQNLTTL